jgi:hypothetical protein
MRSRSILSRSSAAIVAALAVASVLASGTPAPAADTEEMVRKSREHYKKGEELFGAERYAEAYAEFEAGYAMVPRPLFLLNMAHSDRRRGQLRSASALYKRYLVMEPESKFRPEVESVLAEIDRVIAAEDAAAIARSPMPDLTPAPVVVSAPAPKPAPPAAPTPLYRRWWFWAAAGAVVATAVTTTIFLSRDDAYQESGSLGNLGTP